MFDFAISAASFLLSTASESMRGVSRMTGWLLLMVMRGVPLSLQLQVFISTH